MRNFIINRNKYQLLVEVMNEIQEEEAKQNLDLMTMPFFYNNPKDFLKVEHMNKIK